MGKVARALRWRHYLVWGGAGLAAALALGVASFRHPTYQATTLLTINEAHNLGQGFDIAIQDDQVLSQRYINLATSRRTLDRVCAKEASGCSPVTLSRQLSAATTKATGEVAISATAPTPEAAVRLADEDAQAVLAQNRVDVTNQFAPQIQLLQGQLSQLSQQMAATQDAVSAANNANKPDSGPLAQLSLLQNQYQTTYSHLQDAQVQENDLVNGLTLEQAALPPTLPSDPDPVRYVLVGVVAGLVLGFLAALLAERFRDRIMEGAELGEVTGSDLVLVVDGQEAPTVIGSYGLLSPGDPEEAGGGQLLLVAASPEVPVDDLAMELAEAVAGEHRRVLVVPSGAGRAPQQVSEQGAGPQLRPRLRLPDGRSVDLTIRCATPLARPSLWLSPSAGPVVLVAVRGRTRFRQARRTAELLRHLRMDPAIAILLKKGRLAQHGWRPPPAREDTKPEASVSF